ncbi:histone H1 [Ricinus communis]|uniref:Histone h1/h5, putative n=1 Tax=Ricinus communis TaxID=3988 RepID=B9RNJ1_RICCO|nr:histone H1 [Ricinus communis]EEF47314.1 histone h1/h5, putative [Ricinus communis]|eukprot:XP_002515330.1 histone H1 [Ricinus communis]
MAKGTVAVKSKATKNSPPALNHPPYFEMISEAISTLKERTGSSQPAIAKFIEHKYKTQLPPNFKKQLSVQLKKFVKSEKLDKIKNSYKISSTEKLKLVIREAQKPKSALAPKEKAARTKRLGQVKTPDVLKKKAKKNNKDVKGAKMKRLSQVKTPDGFDKKQNSKARK